MPRPATRSDSTFRSTRPRSFRRRGTSSTSRPTWSRALALRCARSSSRARTGSRRASSSASSSAPSRPTPTPSTSTASTACAPRRPSPRPTLSSLSAARRLVRASRSTRASSTAWASLTCARSVEPAAPPRHAARTSRRLRARARDPPRPPKTCARCCVAPCPRPQIVEVNGVAQPLAYVQRRKGFSYEEFLCAPRRARHRRARHRRRASRHRVRACVRAQPRQQHSRAAVDRPAYAPLPARDP